MPFTQDLDLFINTLNDALDGPLDAAFVNLIREKATKVFEPIYMAPGQMAVPAGGGATPAVVAKAKKTPTAYNFFLKDYSSKNPGTANLMKVVGAVWKDMDDAAKAPFMAMATAAKEATATVQVAAGATTPAGVATVATPAKTPKKRGPSGYNLYVSETRNKGVSMKEVGAMWTALSDAEKQPFIDKAKGTPPAVQ